MKKCNAQFSNRFNVLLKKLSNVNLQSLDEKILLETLEEILLSFRLKEIILNIIHNEEKIHELANSSYLHDNGFDKLVLYTATKFGLRLRLHIWWGETNSLTQESTVHNHPWDFASCVVLGRYLMEIFKESEVDGEEYIKTYYPTLANSSQNKPFFESKKVRLCCREVRTVNINNCYCLNSDELHRVMMPNQVTATLVLQGPHKSNFTSVYSNEIERFRNPFDVIHFSTDEIRTKLNKLYELL